ncbi:MAG: hypothetical protein AAF587_20835 [Bacteroidota bacterium]
MSYTEARALYDQFDEAQLQFLTTKTLEGSHTPRKWLKILQKLAKFDELADKSRSKSMRKIFLWGFLSVFTFIFTFILIFPILLAAWFAYLAYKNWKQHQFLKGQDLRNQFRKFLVPLIQILREESAEQEKLYLKLDLNHPLSQQNHVDFQERKGPGYPKFKENYYRSSWLNMSIKLRDQSMLSLALEDVIRKRQVTKTGSSGKIKTKTKTKVKHLASVKVGFPKVQYQPAADRNPEVVFSEDANLMLIKWKQKYTSSSIEDNIPLSELVKAISQTYKQVQPLGNLV